jgi:hypothetical protein
MWALAMAVVSLREKATEPWRKTDASRFCQSFKGRDPDIRDLEWGVDSMLSPFKLESPSGRIANRKGSAQSAQSAKIAV